MAKLWWQSF